MHDINLLIKYKIIDAKIIHVMSRLVFIVQNSALHNPNPIDILQDEGST